MDERCSVMIDSNSKNLCFTEEEIELIDAVLSMLTDARNLDNNSVDDNNSEIKDSDNDDRCLGLHIFVEGSMRNLTHVVEVMILALKVQKGTTKTLEGRKSIIVASLLHDGVYVDRYYSLISEFMQGSSKIWFMELCKKFKLDSLQILHTLIEINGSMNCNYLIVPQKGQSSSENTFISVASVFVVCAIVGKPDISELCRGIRLSYHMMPSETAVDCIIREYGRNGTMAWPGTYKLYFKHELNKMYDIIDDRDRLTGIYTKIDKEICRGS